MSPLRSLSILSLLLGGCILGPASAENAEFRERLLATLPDDVRVIVPVAFSEDGRHAAYVERRGDVSRVVRGNWEGKPFQVLC